MEKEIDLYVFALENKQQMVHDFAHQVLDEIIEQRHHVKPYYIYGKYGKPYVVNIERCFFNISHSGAYVAIGFSQEEIGVDIEEISDRHDYLKVAERFFSTAEKKLMQKSDDSRKEFFSIWTQKEAYIKYSGEQISEMFGIFDVIEKRQKAFSKTIEINNCIVTVCTATEQKVNVYFKQEKASK